MDDRENLWGRLTDWERSPVYNYFLNLRIKQHIANRDYDGLIEMGRPAVDALIKALKARNVYVRRNAPCPLGEIGDKSAAPALIKALNDKDIEVRRDAAWALGKIGDGRAAPALIKALNDKYVHARDNAAWALGKIGDTSAVPELFEALRDEARDVRRSAAGALGSIAKKCKTIEEVERIEKTIIEASSLLRKGHFDKTVLDNAQLQLAQVLKQIAEKKNELAPKRDLLLPDTIKPPKKGDVYSIVRRVRHG